VWNHRVVKTGRHYGIHEAFYHEGDKFPHSITEDAMQPCGETVQELREDLERMLNALDEPVLKDEDF